MSVATTPAPPSESAIGTLSQWALIRRRFAHHKLAVASLYLLAVLYVIAIGAEFFAPYPRQWRDLARAYCPPQLPLFSPAHGIYVPAMKRLVDPLTFKKSYIEDPAQVVEVLGDLLLHCHLGDADLGGSDDDLPCGRLHDLSSFVAALDASGFRGTASFDLYGAVVAGLATGLEAVRESRDHVLSRRA